MSFVPHNHFEPAKEVAHPTPDPHQDAAARLARRGPWSAYVALALVAIGFTFLYFGRTYLLEALCFAVAALAAAAFALLVARRSRRPVSAAVGGLALSLIIVFAAVRLWS